MYSDSCLDSHRSFSVRLLRAVFEAESHDHPRESGADPVPVDSTDGGCTARHDEIGLAGCDADAIQIGALPELYLSKLQHTQRIYYLLTIYTPDKPEGFPSCFNVFCQFTVLNNKF